MICLWVVVLAAVAGCWIVVLGVYCGLLGCDCFAVLLLVFIVVCLVVWVVRFGVGAV